MIGSTHTPPHGVSFDPEFRMVTCDSASSAERMSSAPASPAEERLMRLPGLLRTPSEVPVVRARLGIARAMRNRLWEAIDAAAHEGAVSA